MILPAHVVQMVSDPWKIAKVFFEVFSFEDVLQYSIQLTLRSLIIDILDDYVITALFFTWDSANQNVARGVKSLRHSGWYLSDRRELCGCLSDFHRSSLSSKRKG